MTGHDLIAFAGKLAADSRNGEPSFRSAVSRAYYGAFHIACALLDELGIVVPKNAIGWPIARMTTSRMRHEFWTTFEATGTMPTTIWHSQNSGSREMPGLPSRERRP